MIKLIKNVEVYAPKYLGVKDVLIASNKIAEIKENINIEYENIEIINGEGQILFPGFIDNHVHILGGGGEGGFKTRTPELNLSTAIKAGVTTVIGCIGTDGVTRKMESLVAKAKSLKEEGLSCYVYTGSYDVPVRTLFPDIRTDIILVDEIIGVGEIAVSDHRTSNPNIDELSRIIGEDRVGGMLASKCGCVNIHLGDNPKGLKPIFEIVEKESKYLKHIVPTHMNRNPDLFEEGIEYALKGGAVDFTTSTTPVFLEEGEVKCSKALKILLDKGVNVENITFSSDGQGSLPEFDENGETIGLKIGTMESLYKEVKDSIFDEKITIEEAIKVITSNNSKRFLLHNKGEIKVGKDADLVLVNKDDLDIRTVIGNGNVLMKDNELIVKGTFE